MNLRHLANRLFYKLHHVSKFPKGNLTGCLMNLARRGLQPARVIDVGANRGGWSSDLRAVFPNCECVLVEPQIEMKNHLDRFCQRNPGCTWICAGAGEAVGELPFTVYPDTVSSSFAATRAGSGAEGLVQRIVPVTTLDQICKERWNGEAPDIVKVDAEGFETQILRGARTLLGKTELFFLEAHFFGAEIEASGLVPLTAAMNEFGYLPYDFTWFGKRPYDGAVGLCEIAFVRKEGVLRSYQGWNAPRSKAA